MTADELKAVMHEWRLNAAQFARILCLHTNKMSEYLDGVERIPCATAFSIDTLRRLPDDVRNALFKERLNRKPHTKTQK